MLATVGLLLLGLGLRVERLDDSGEPRARVEAGTAGLDWCSTRIRAEAFGPTSVPLLLNQSPCTGRQKGWRVALRVVIDPILNLL